MDLLLNSVLNVNVTLREFKKEEKTDVPPISSGFLHDMCGSL